MNKCGCLFTLLPGLFLADFRNILSLTNAFNIGDENITLENYQDWFSYLNTTDPMEVESLHLKTCNLQTFLEQVGVFEKIFVFFFFCVCGHVLCPTFRAPQEPDWPSLCSLRQWYTCQDLRCGRSFSLSCSSAWACPPCLEILRGFLLLCWTYTWSHLGFLRKFSQVYQKIL